MAHFLTPLLDGSGGSWRLVNATRGLVLADTIEAAFESGSRKRGLLGRDSLGERTAVIIAPSSAIHTFGMRFAIDVLFVNRRGEVLKRVTGLKRWRIAVRPRAFAAIELAAHHAGVARTACGDRLLVERELPAT
jgi:uncharacterized protein